MPLQFILVLNLSGFFQMYDLNTHIVLKSLSGLLWDPLKIFLEHKLIFKILL